MPARCDKCWITLFGAYEPSKPTNCRDVRPGQSFPLNTRDVRLDAETEVFLVIGITCVPIALLVFWVEPLSVVGVLEYLEAVAADEC